MCRAMLEHIGIVWQCIKHQYPLGFNQSVNNTISSYLGLMRRLTMLFRISNQHDTKHSQRKLKSATKSFCQKSVLQWTRETSPQILD